jgi:iron complex transport system substrate-binding protein
VRRLIVSSLLLCALLAGCARVDAPPAAAPAAATEAAEEAPQRIVSLSATHTETLFAIGAGDRVVAVDDQSDYPEGVPVTDLSGYEPNIEAIAGYEPDLVVLSDDTDDVLAGLDAIGIETLVLSAPTTIDEAFAQMTDLGAAVGQEAEAGELVASSRRELEELADQVPDRPEPISFYHELDDTLYSVTSSTFIGQVYELAGLENVADAADAQGQSGGYPQLTPEYLVQADPDLVFLADTECCGQSAETVAGRPGLAELTAVREGRVVELSDDVASRWGPRVVDFLRAVVDATTTVPAP